MSSTILSKLFTKALVYKSDEELMVEFVAGNSQAFNLLYDRHKDSLYSYFSRMVTPEVAEELLQEMFTKFIMAKSQYRSESKLRTWLWKIANNTLIDFWRSRNHQYDLKKIEFDEMDFHELNKDDSLENELIERKTREQLNECIDKLPMPQKQIVTLHIYSELSHQEIADVTKISISAIKSTLFRSKEKLIDCFNFGEAK